MDPRKHYPRPRGMSEMMKNSRAKIANTAMIQRHRRAAGVAENIHHGVLERVPSAMRNFAERLLRDRLFARRHN